MSDQIKSPPRTWSAAARKGPSWTDSWRWCRS